MNALGVTRLCSMEEQNEAKVPAEKAGCWSRQIHH